MGSTLSTGGSRSLVVAAAIFASGYAQQQAPIPVPGAIRSRVTLIPVEVSVTDRAGRPVKTLRADDFVVFEDGVRQEISQFSTHDFLEARPQTPERAAVSAKANSPDGRTFLVLLGRGRLDEPSKGMAALEAFVREGLEPPDRVAVMAYSRVTDVITDRKPVLRLLAEYRTRYKRIETDLDEWFTGLTLVYAGKDIPPHIQRQIDAIFAVPGLPPSRELPTTHLVRRPTTDDRTLSYADLDEMQRLLQLSTDPISILDDDEGQRLQTEGRQDWQALLTALEYLRYIEGSKHLIYLTEKPLFGDMTQIARIANDAGVSIWPVQTGGSPTVRWTKTYPPRFIGPQFRDLFALLGLRAVADETGGRASIQEFSEKGFRTLLSTTSFQYVLGYSPARRVDDGRYHELKVDLRNKERADRSGLAVRHRSGYFAREKVIPTDFREFQAHRRILSASQHWRDIRDVAMKWQEPGIVVDDEQRQVLVQVSIDPTSLSLVEEEGFHKASLDFAVFALDPRGRPVGQTWQTVDVALNGELLERARQSGITYRSRVTMTDDAKEIRVAAYQFSVDRVGTITQKIR